MLALERHMDIIYGDSNTLAKICPMSCLQVTSIQSGKDITFIGNHSSKFYREFGELNLYFEKFIRVLETYWAYSGLSLLAEVGGYVGLFLGVSVNQVSYVIRKVLTLIRQKY